MNAPRMTTEQLCQALCTLALQKAVAPYLPFGLDEDVLAWLRDTGRRKAREESLRERVGNIIDGLCPATDLRSRNIVRQLMEAVNDYDKERT